MIVLSSFTPQGIDGDKLVLERIWLVTFLSYKVTQGYVKLLWTDKFGILYNLLELSLCDFFLSSISMQQGNGGINSVLNESDWHARSFRYR